VSGPPLEAPLVGTRLGDYRIEAVLGRGGMGVVYRAMQLSLERTVALKVISPALAADPEFRRRFERECRLAASIEHPNVVPVYGAGEEDGQLYVTMRYVEGTDLAALLLGTGALPPRRACRIVAGVAAALDAAHARGLVHRDVKPANVLLVPHEDEDQVYLTDFGVAKHLAASASLTATGEVLGTLDYIAPEQIEGLGATARSDVYALGCLLFQVLTGRVPFPHDTPTAKIAAHLTAAPPAPSMAGPTPPSLDAVVLRAMAKRPEERFPTAGELGRAALAAVASPAPITEPTEVGSVDFAPTGTILTSAHRPTAAQEPLPPPPPPPPAAGGLVAGDPLGGPVAAPPPPPPRIPSGPPARPLPPPLPPRQGGGGVSPLLVVAVLVCVAAVGAFLLTRGGDDEGGGQTIADQPPARDTSGGGGGSRPRAKFVAYRAPTYTADRPDGWKVNPDYEQQGRVRRTGFASPDGSSGLTIDRTAGVTGTPEELGSEVDDDLSRSVPGYQLARSREVALPGGPAYELRYAADRNEAPPRGAAYVVPQGEVLFVVTSTGPDDRTVTNLAKRVAGSLRPAEGAG